MGCRAFLYPTEIGGRDGLLLTCPICGCFGGFAVVAWWRVREMLVALRFFLVEYVFSCYRHRCPFVATGTFCCHRMSAPFVIVHFSCAVQMKGECSRSLECFAPLLFRWCRAELGRWCLAKVQLDQS